MPDFKTAAERAAYWRGRHDEATDALAHERARVDGLLHEARKWVTPAEVGRPVGE